MCILPNATAAAPAARSPAHALPAAARQQLALDALAGCPVTELARGQDVSRKFVYQQADKAAQALAAAFAPPPPAEDAVLFYLPVTEAWLRRLILALLLGQVPVHPEQFCANTSRTGEGYNFSKPDPFRGLPMSKQSVKPSVVGPWSPLSAGADPCVPSSIWKQSPSSAF